MNETRKKPTIGTRCSTLFGRWHGIFYMSSRTDTAGHTRAFIYPVMEHGGGESKCSSTRHIRTTDLSPVSAITPSWFSNTSLKSFPVSLRSVFTLCLLRENEIRENEMPEHYSSLFRVRACHSLRIKTVSSGLRLYTSGSQTGGHAPPPPGGHGAIAGEP